MPLIKASELGEDLEDKVVPEGNYPLRITSSKAKTSKAGDRRMVAIGMVIEGTEGEGAATVWHNVLFPKDDDDGAATRRWMRDLKRFLTVFGLPTDQDIDPDAEDCGAEWVGATTENGHLTNVAERDSNDQPTGNRKNELRLPKIA
jgi:hypothetical protein